MSDELSDLRLFTKIVSAGSLSETARRLNTSLTAMSRRLAQMSRSGANGSATAPLTGPAGRSTSG